MGFKWVRMSLGGLEGVYVGYKGVSVGNKGFKWVLSGSELVKVSLGVLKLM